MKEYHLTQRSWNDNVEDLPSGLFMYRDKLYIKTDMGEVYNSEGYRCPTNMPLFRSFVLQPVEVVKVIRKPTRIIPAPSETPNE